MPLVTGVDEVEQGGQGNSRGLIRHEVRVVGGEACRVDAKTVAMSRSATRVVTRLRQPPGWRDPDAILVPPSLG
jgi:hypothetical protein